MINRRKFVGAGGALALAALAAPAVVRAQTTTLKIQGFLPATTSPQQALDKMAKDLAAASGGRLQLQVLPGGGAVAVTEALDAVRNGILDGNYTAASYFAGKDPAFTLLGDTGSSFNDVVQRDRWFSEGGGTAIAREVYERYGVHFVGPVFWASEHIPARKALNGVDDMKGLKIRVPPGLIADILGRAGASVVNIAGGEVFNALQSGVIDATDWASPALNTQAGLYKIAKFSVNASHSMPTTDIGFNKRKWESLPQEFRTMIEQGVAKMSAELSATLKADDEKALAGMKEQGVTVITWNAGEVAKLRKFTSSVQSELAGRNDLARKVYDSLSAFQKKAGVA
jgi:TRAP-type mannitol/chloroaromatic compound transport system substrate-binding protein